MVQTEWLTGELKDLQESNWRLQTESQLILNIVKLRLHDMIGRESCKNSVKWPWSMTQHNKITSWTRKWDKIGVHN